MWLCRNESMTNLENKSFVAHISNVYGYVFYEPYPANVTLKLFVFIFYVVDCIEKQLNEFEEISLVVWP